MVEKEKIVSDVKNYYGEKLKTSDDLQTTACCAADSMPKYVREIISQIHPEVLEKFYGCGSPIPAEIGNKAVLDLGCGSGRDVFIFSKLIENGQAIGIDMTDEQIAVAESHKKFHTELFNLKDENIVFKQGYIEDLKSLDIKDNSIDVVTSNCVINLSVNKQKVFSEIFRVLKNNGELYFSDIFADKRIPKNLQSDPELVGECLGGALYFEDFRRIIQDLGFKKIFVSSKTKIDLKNNEIENKLKDINFYSINVRIFKSDLEDQEENYGQTAEYLGTIKHLEDKFFFDECNEFVKNKKTNISGNLARVLTQSRYAKHFKIEGDETHHLGLFEKEISKPKSSSCC